MVTLWRELRMCSPRKPGCEGKSGALRGMAGPDQRATGALGLLRAPLRAHACSQEALRTHGGNLVASSWWGRQKLGDKFSPSPLCQGQLNSEASCISSRKMASGGEVIPEGWLHSPTSPHPSSSLSQLPLPSVLLQALCSSSKPGLWGKPG